MNQFFTYSLLQYKHSVVFGEFLNVGILFYFHDEKKFEFVSGNTQRLRSIYPDFDNVVFNNCIKSIYHRTETPIGALQNQELEPSINDYIKKYILGIDAAGLIFKEPAQVVNSYSDNKRIIEEYSNLLLPGRNLNKGVSERHNEKYIISKYTNFLHEVDPVVSQLLERDKEVKTKNIKLNFEAFWENGTKNHVKPLSFDLLKPQAIQEKAVTYAGYLSHLNDYAKEHNTRFDFLISKPQSKELKKEYENALDILSSSKTNKKIVTEEELPKYSEQTIDALIHHNI